MTRRKDSKKKRIKKEKRVRKNRRTKALHKLGTGMSTGSTQVRS